MANNIMSEEQLEGLDLSTTRSMLVKVLNQNRKLIELLKAVVYHDLPKGCEEEVELSKILFKEGGVDNDK